MSQHLHLHLLLLCHIFCQTKVKNDKTWFPDTPIAKIKYWRSLPADNIQLGDDVYFECEVATCRNWRQQQNTYRSFLSLPSTGVCESRHLQHHLAAQRQAVARERGSRHHHWEPDSRPAKGHLSIITMAPSSQLIFIYDIDIKCNQYNTDYRYIFNWASP